MTTAQLPSCPSSHPNALGLLRVLVRNWVFLPPQQGQITQEFMQRSGFAATRVLKDWTVVGLSKVASQAFLELADLIATDIPTLNRAVILSDYQNHLFAAVAEGHRASQADKLLHSDVDNLIADIHDWLAKKSGTTTVLIPCAITPWPSPRFSIGPVRFVFIDDAKSTELHPPPAEWNLDQDEFAKFLKEAAARDANWVAAVDVEGCAVRKAIDIGQLAVDLALAGIQVSAPRAGIKTIARINKMRGRAFETTVTVRNGHWGWGHSNHSPGLSIGQGYMQEIQRIAQRTFTSVGNRVTGFASGQFRLPVLEGAWCDGAYWMHEGLAETIDSISVAKLETALEVLLGAESSKGSEAKMLKALHTFFGLSPDDPITPGSNITTKRYAKDLVGGRSRVLHGTLSTLSSNLVQLRDQLEFMATTLVRSTAIEIDEYLADGQVADDIDIFLDWVRTARTMRIQSSDP